VNIALKSRASTEAAEAERKKAMAPFAGFRFHDLRHCVITKLAESEASDQTIMSILQSRGSPTPQAAVPQ
jgi:integrase